MSCVRVRWRRQFVRGHSVLVGLDISSVATGYAIIAANDARCIALGRIASPRNAERYSAVELVADTLVSAIHGTATPFHSVSIGVEDYLRMFATARRGLHTLAEVNSLILYALYQRTGVRAIKFHASAARKSCGITVGKSGGGVKLASWAHMIQRTADALTTRDGQLIRVHQFDVAYDKAGAIDKTNFDVSDAFVIAHALFNIQANTAQTPSQHAERRRSSAVPVQSGVAT